MKRGLLLIALVAGIGVARWIDLNPVEIDLHEVEQAATLPASAGKPVALLVADPEFIADSAAAGQWRSLDFSFAWWGDLREEFGPTAWCKPASLPDNLGSSLQLVVWSSSAATQAPPDELLAWVRSGGLLVIDAVTPAWGEVLGLDLADPQPAERLDRIANTPALWSDDDHRNLPVFGERRALVGSTPPSATPTLWLDGAESSWALDFGAGRILALGVEFARWTSALRQGVCDSGFTVTNTRGSEGREQFYQPNDFMADPDRSSAWLPRADLLLRAQLSALFADRTLLRAGGLPAGARGLFLMNHDEEYFGDRSRFMSEESARHGVHSTMFVVPGHMSADGARAIVEDGCDIQLHWNRGFWRRQTRTFGLGPFQPIIREMSLAEQRDALAAVLPEGSAVIDENRNHGLLWDDNFTRSFRILEAAGFVFDSTYGPDEELFGWVFDTARPFQPVDTNGLPFGILELPFPWQDDENYRPDWQRRMIEESAATINGVLAPVFHTVTMEWNPAEFRMQGWLESYDVAAELDHPVWSVREYLEFRERRMATIIDRDEHGYWSVSLPADDIVLEIPEAAPALELLVGDHFENLELAPSVRGWRGVALGEGTHTLRERQEGS